MDNPEIPNESEPAELQALIEIALVDAAAVAEAVDQWRNQGPEDYLEILDAEPVN